MAQKLKYEQFGLTDIGNVRQANEDSFGFAETPFGPVFTVCDGMGGHVGGATASRIAVNCIIRYVSESKGESSFIEINNAIVNANKEILDAVVADPGLKGMGTTCTALYVSNTDVHIGHVGDSRIYLYSDGKLNRLTRDHSFVQGLVDSGVITDAQAESHPRKNELTKALGVHAAVEPTINEAPIHPKKGDTFLMCTDGLCGLVSEAKIESVLASSSELKDSAQRLIDAAKEAGGFDNITVQLVRITESPYSRSEFVSMNAKQTLAQTIVPETDEPEVKPATDQPKFNKRTIGLVIASIVVLLCIGYFVVWPMIGSDGVEVNKDSIPDTAKDKLGDKPISALDLPSCCTIDKSSFIIHTIKEGESYSSILEKHQMLLKEYNLDEPFNQNGTDPLDKNRIVANQKLVWKPRPVTKPKEIPNSQNLNPVPDVNNNNGQNNPDNADSNPKPPDPPKVDCPNKTPVDPSDTGNKKKPK